MNRNLKHLYEFGPFRLDATERLLLRDGDLIPLTPKAFDLLLAMVEQPGRLLEKAALLKAVWPDSFVEENNLADNVSRLRKALGEGEQGMKFIETIPKRGYRFVAVVRNQESVVTRPVVEQATPPTDAHEFHPTAPAANSRPPWRKRSVAILRVLVFVAPALIAAALWVDFWVRKKIELYRLEVQGELFVTKSTEDDVRNGIEFFNRAVVLDPNSATAHAGLAVGWIFLSDLHTSPREAMPKAKASAMKAIELDEKSANPHVSLGMIKMQYEWDWPGAEEEFKRAIALDPGRAAAHQLYGWLLIAVGRFEEGQAETKRALETDPLNDFQLWGRGLSFYFARQYEPAIEQYRRAIGVTPRSHWSHMLLGWAYEQQDKFSDAIAELKQSSRLTDNPQALASLGHAYAASGGRAEAQKVIAELQDSAKRKYVSPFDMAVIYAGLQEKEQALAWLEKAYEERSGWLALWLKVDPRFDKLRSDPRFRNLLLRTGHVL
jgi:DNA-binding winged helix-turn-helix (wHTH) protein/Flp pilus assembly protein TadD